MSIGGGEGGRVACKAPLVEGTGHYIRHSGSPHTTQWRYRRLRTSSGALGAKSKTNPGVAVYHRLSSWKHPLGVDHPLF